MRIGIVYIIESAHLLRKKRPLEQQRLIYRLRPSANDLDIKVTAIVATSNASIFAPQLFPPPGNCVARHRRFSLVRTTAFQLIPAVMAPTFSTRTIEIIHRRWWYALNCNFQMIPSYFRYSNWYSIPNNAKSTECHFLQSVKLKINFSFIFFKTIFFLQCRFINSLEKD